jgi:hypothetical protein
VNGSTIEIQLPSDFPPKRDLTPRPEWDRPLARLALIGAVLASVVGTLHILQG